MLFKDSSIDKLQFSVMTEEQLCAICSNKVATRVCLGCNNTLHCESCFQETHDRGYRKRHIYSFIEYE